MPTMHPSSLAPRPLAAGVVFALFALGSFDVVVAQQGTAVDAVATTRATLEQWVATRSLVSKEARDWQLKKEAVTSRMDVIKREIVALQKRTAEAESNLAAAEQKRRELLAESEVLAATAKTLAERVVQLEQRLLGLLPRLPQPLRDKVAPLTQRIPAKDAAVPPTLSLGDRYAAVVGVLNEVHKWNREITVTSEVRQQPDGSSVEVAVLYAGLGQAWYVSANGKVAGSGSATADGWIWRAANETGPQVQRAIAVWKNEQPAAFVGLPVQVQ